MEVLKLKSGMTNLDFFNLVKTAGKGRYGVSSASDRLDGDFSGFVIDYSKAWCAKYDKPFFRKEGYVGRPLTYSTKPAGVNIPGKKMLTIMEFNTGWEQDLVELTLKDQARIAVEEVEYETEVRRPLDLPFLTAVRNYCSTLEVNPYSVNIDRENDEFVIRYSGQKRSLKSYIMETAEKVILTDQAIELDIEEGQAKYARELASRFNRTTDDKVSFIEDNGVWKMTPQGQYKKSGRSNSFRSKVREVARKIQSGKDLWALVGCDADQIQYARTLVSIFNKSNNCSISVQSTDDGVLLYLPDEKIDKDNLIAPVLEQWSNIPDIGPITEKQRDALEKSTKALIGEIEERVSLDFS